MDSTDSTMLFVTFSVSRSHFASGWSGFNLNIIKAENVSHYHLALLSVPNFFLCTILSYRMRSCNIEFVTEDDAAAYQSPHYVWCSCSWIAKKTNLLIMSNFDYIKII